MTTEADENESTPNYIHDCDQCVYLGDIYNPADRDEMVDLYYCDNQLGNTPTVIARQGSEPSDYSSGLCFATINPLLAVATIRAIKQGLVSLEMITLDGCEVKVGDRLWSTTYGWVEVRQIKPDITFAIRTTFGNYSASGKCTTRGPRSLFWDEVKIDPPPPPKRKVKTYQWLVKDKDADCAYVTVHNHSEERVRARFHEVIRPIEETIQEVEV